MIQGAPVATAASPGDNLGAGHGLHLYIGNQQTTAGLYQSEAIVNLCTGSINLPSYSGNGGVSADNQVMHEPTCACYEAPQPATTAACNDTTLDRNCNRCR
jgi:hypothetical protein